MEVLGRLGRAQCSAEAEPALWGWRPAFRGFSSCFHDEPQPHNFDVQLLPDLEITP